MSVRDFPSRPDGADDAGLMDWLDSLGDRQNIDKQIEKTSPVPTDETYLYDSASYGTKKVTLANLRRPSTAAGVAQTATNIYGGTGAPSNSDGQNGDYYFRSDGGLATHIYFKSAGTWAGII